MNSSDKGIVIENTIDETIGIFDEEDNFVRAGTRKEMVLIFYIFITRERII
jgi:hypothetical protein